MTDRFEDAVRDAVQGLPSAEGEVPSYHDAWNRGRRRRFVKRSALAAASAVVVLAALTVNLGRFPGAGTAEVDDVATGIEAAEPLVEPTPLTTTSPIETPTLAPTVPSLAIPEPTPNRPTPVAAAEVAPTPTITPAPVVTPSPPEATPVPTLAPVEPGATPTAVETPTPEPTPYIPLPEPTTDPAQAAETTQGPTDTTGTPEQPADPDARDEPPPGVDLALTTAAPADATILGEPVGGAALPCDLDDDGVADARCELLVFEYACSGDADARPGYTAVDLDGDDLVDTCVVMDITLCDTENDGRGDTPCIIELNPPTSDANIDE